MTKFSCLALTGAMLVGAEMASAATVTAHLDSITNFQAIDVSMNGHASKMSVYGGQLNWTRTGGDYTDLGGPSSSTQFSTFCVELTQHVSLNSTYTYNVVSLDLAPDPGGSGVGTGMGVGKALQLTQLWSQHRGEVLDNLSGAAFQLAVWEIVYDDDTMLNSGSFQAWNSGSSVAVKAQGWLDSLLPSNELPLLGGLSNIGLQDQVFFVSDPPIHEPPTAVPVPAAAWSGGILLAALGANRVRRRLAAA